MKNSNDENEVIRMKDTRFSYFRAGRICAHALVVFLLVGSTGAQTNEMQIVSKPEKITSEIVARRDANGRFCAAIQVVSDLTGLSYDSYNGVVGVDKKPGMDMVFVQPDERVLEIFCTGYVPLKIIFSEVGITPKEKEVWKITITGEKKLAEIPINILTNPEGSTVFIDGQPMGNGRNFQVASGKHTLRLTLDGHRPITKQIDVSETSTLFEYTLEVVEPVMMTITSSPTGATIFIDDVDEGQTNKQLFKFPGEYSLRISKSKYETIDQTITVSETGKNTWAFSLVKTTAILTISTTPADAGIWVNGEQKTTKALEVAPGKYRIEVKKDGWYGDSRTVTVEKGQDQSQTFSLQQMTGKLQLVVEPMETKVLMKQGNQQIDTWSGSKYKKDIPVGQYTLEFSAVGYGDQSKTVSIEENKTESLNVNMEKRYESSFNISYTNCIEIDSNIYVSTSDGKTIPITFLKRDFGPILSDIDIFFVRDTRILGKDEYERMTQLKVLRVNLSTLKEEVLIDSVRYKDRVWKNSSPLYRVGNLSISNNKQYLFFLTQKWAVSDVLIRYDLTTNEQTEITHADEFRMLKLHPYKDNILVWRSKIIDGYGRKGEYYILNFDGKLIEDLGDFENINAAEEYVFNSRRISDNTGHEKSSIDMVFVKGGTFTMGDIWGDGDGDEKPIHRVTLKVPDYTQIPIEELINGIISNPPLKDFYLGIYEVTQRLYQQVMGSNPSYFEGEDLPVESVTWYDAIDFCNKLGESEGLIPCYTINGTSVICNFSANGYRLPTEAEWEYAARSGGRDDRKLSGTNNEYDLGSYAWYDENSENKTHPVGYKRPNDLGLYDMSGNVWEWCWDWYHNYSSSSLCDPTGPATGKSRVLRGGSWNYYSYGCRAAGRSNSDPTYRDNGLGFRVLRIGEGSGSRTALDSGFKTGTVTDIDSNTYQTVKIGNQWWMTENLKVTHYRNGNAIPNVTDDSAWSSLTTGAYCIYNHDESNATTYGRLYNCYAVTDSRNIAPAGWHVPTDAEWTTLTT